MTLLCTAVERASCGADKLFGTGEVPTTLACIAVVVLVVVDGLFGLQVRGLGMSYSWS